MSKQLNALKQCQTSRDLAKLLGYSYKGFCYVLYSAPIHTKYRMVTIPKKNSPIGRQILIPSNRLKILQQRLATLLTNIYLEINQNNPSCCYAFIPDSNTQNFGIVENAKQHINKNIVLNIDLKDFFTSITFSRIVGFFTKNIQFRLNYDVAITLAQIACYRASPTSHAYLPQGSPCSPIISNFVGQIIDSKITFLAKKFHFTYSRYADDLTLSFDKNQIDSKILEYDQTTREYKLGKLLEKEILKTNFQINYQKLCVRTKRERQQVTGLVVNKSVNVNKAYYYHTKSMALEYCRNGTFTRSTSHAKKIGQPNFHSLMGYFNYIHETFARINTQKFIKLV
ncbi:reverse transcriptase domain-containing protein [Acinetobacter sp. YH16038]|uniref:reverse transcriptase domain-containing protein n=1 Tax=Acinetobacter sp. YH16038 TaxID=2601183 RepID=UPI0015D10883|nr:reverse transcriptase domain-containing protein [Acinetobacter sp. YH16038]